MSDEKKSPLPADPTARKNIPLGTGCLDYFPAALAAVAEVSFVGNEKHNPGEPLHHSRGKSSDHADAMLRHFEERGGVDVVKLPDGRTFRVRHSAEMAWRALALLQEELEAAGEAPLARGAVQPLEPVPVPVVISGQRCGRCGAEVTPCSQHPRLTRWHIDMAAPGIGYVCCACSGSHEP